jgi:hypothetical protein
MHLDQVRKTWRSAMVNKLKERYGIAEEEAQKKAEEWLLWVSQGAQLFKD